MNTILKSAAMVLAIGISACSDPKTAQPQSDTVQQPVAEKKENIVSIAEIAVTDFARAVKFYQTVLGISIEEMDMAGTKMGLFPGDGTTVHVALVKGDDYKPSKDGSIIYLNAGKDLQPVLDKIAKNGGQTLVPKTEISPEMGYFALFIDSEGNRLGLHSSN
jgi:predicted enzyme related to lactoylglutathione lyase